MLHSSHHNITFLPQQNHKITRSRFNHNALQNTSTSPQNHNVTLKPPQDHILTTTTMSRYLFPNPWGSQWGSQWGEKLEISSNGESWPQTELFQSKCWFNIVEDKTCPPSASPITKATERIWPSTGKIFWPTAISLVADTQVWPAALSLWQAGVFWNHPNI